MSLMNIYKNNDFSWNIRESRRVTNKLPSLTKVPDIDYEKLKWLCEVSESGTRDGSVPEEVHHIFMQNYRKIFRNKAEIKNPLRQHKVYMDSRSKKLKSVAEADNHHMKDRLVARKEVSHKSGSLLPLCHKQPDHEDIPKDSIHRSIQSIRTLLRKYPFKRTSQENDKLCRALKCIDFFRNNVDPAELQALCAVAYLEQWKEVNIAVYGKTGIHLLLKGSAVPVSDPCLVTGSTLPNNFVYLDDSDLHSSSRQKLQPGDCLGTWLSCDDLYTRELSVVTAEPNCEFLKISSTDYNRVLAQITQKERDRKVSLLVSCDCCKSWPRQPLISLADYLEWRTYPPGTAILTEGLKAPFIGFIQHGECHVLRQVVGLAPSREGQKKKCIKQVVVGKLGPCNSFGEISVLINEPCSCSVVTTSDVQLAVITPEHVQALEEVTKSLIKQSSTQTFGKLTKDDILDAYIQQETNRKWNDFKHAQVMEVISARGIRPGYGKWSR